MRLELNSAGECTTDVGTSHPFFQGLELLSLVPGLFQLMKARMSMWASCLAIIAGCND